MHYWHLAAALLTLATVSAQAQSNTPDQSASGSNQVGSGSGVSAEQANNPSEPIPQLTLQDSYSGSLDGFGSHGKDQNFALARFLIPFSKLDPLPLNILRLDVPVQTTPDNTTALGDISGVDVLFVVNKPGFRLGLGPTFSLPTDTYHLAGAGKWELGPAALAIYTGAKGWVLGGLAQNSVSFAGHHNARNVDTLSVQPFLVKLLPQGYFVRVDPVMTFDWTKGGAATIPINVGVGRFFKIGKQSVNAYIQPEWNLHRPDDDRIVPRFTLRLNLTLLFPSEKK